METGGGFSQFLSASDCFRVNGVLYNEFLAAYTSLFVLNNNLIPMHSMYSGYFWSSCESATNSPQ